MGGKVRYGAALAESPEGPYVKTPGKIFEAEMGSKHWLPAEDPFIVHSAKYGNRYYAVARDIVGTFSGSEGGICRFQSAGGLDWKPATHPKVLGNQFLLSGRSKSTFKLECSALLIENGEPTHHLGATDGYLKDGRISSDVQIALVPRF